MKTYRFVKVAEEGQRELLGTAVSNVKLRDGMDFAIIRAPEGFTVEQLKAFKKHWDELFDGKLPAVVLSAGMDVEVCRLEVVEDDNGCGSE